jgi:hypothetical protein
VVCLQFGKGYPLQCCYGHGALFRANHFGLTF